MESPSPAREVPPAPIGPVRYLLRWLASFKLAVVLIIVLAAILAYATVLERMKGTEFVHWYVYDNTWFIVLLSVMAVNVLAATLIRFPWKWRQAPFLVTHVGLLALMAGSIQTFIAGIEGQISFVEGEEAKKILSTYRTRLAASLSGKKGRVTIEHPPFRPGPVDWPKGKSLDFGEFEGVGLKVLKFYRHSRRRADWAADESKRGSPALKLALVGRNGETLAENWLPTEQSISSVFVGPIKLELQQAPSDSMLKDFLERPDKVAEGGVLSMHFRGQMHRVDVGQKFPRRVPVGDSGIEVEIVESLANAVPGRMGSFKSQGNEPKNPMLELRVHVPGQEEPIRQIAFAKLPFLNLDMVHGRRCPVAFWFHHPGVSAPAGAEFLRTADGKLYCRATAGGLYRVHGQVKPGDRIEVTPEFGVKILEYIPHARQEVAFESVKVSPSDKVKPEAAALIGVSVGGISGEVWLKRNDPQHGYQRISTPKGPLDLVLGYEQIPLGFSLKLLDFKRGRNPGGMGDASFASSVRLIDKENEINQRREIFMNNPLEHGKFTFYQSSYRETPDGKEGSVLSAAYDPGRFLKYLGSLLLCVGMFFFVWTRYASMLKALADGKDWPSKATRVAALMIAALLGTPAIGASAAAEKPATARFDWEAWRHLPVLDRGRHKPLDTFAREVALSLYDRTSFTDPQTQRTLDPAAFYVATLFDWQGWQRDEAAVLDTAAAYFKSHKADKWDRAELFTLDSAKLGKALGLPEDKKRVSPLELVEARIKDPDSARKMPFTAWTRRLQAHAGQGLSEFEEQAVELAGRLQAYQNHRMGYGLQVLPVPGSEDRQWASPGQLMATDLDKEIDPTGTMQKVKARFGKALTAYRSGSASDFTAASNDFIDILAGIGPRLGTYPEQSKIDLEVGYNRWAPFRWAWILALAAFAALLLNMFTHWKPLYVAGIGSFVLSLTATVAGFWMRAVIRGWAPVTNMYETVVYMAMGVIIFGLALEAFSRRRYIVTAAAAVATLTLLLADFCGDILDPSIRPLPPVLRSNYWLVIHVMTIILSYATFALALAVGNITLGLHLAAAPPRTIIRGLSGFTYLLLLIGVFLLTVGTILGALWADYSWGRFWSWDSKEVWALITLLGYSAMLHARFIRGWMSDLGLAAWSVVCFMLVLMAWYGVNFILGTGLHAYGTGAGGQYYVLGAAGLQLLYVFTAVAVAKARTPAEESAA